MMYRAGIDLGGKQICVARYYNCIMPDIMQPPLAPCAIIS